MRAQNIASFAALVVCLLAVSGCQAGRHLLQANEVPAATNVTDEGPSVQLAAELMNLTGTGTNVTNSTIFVPSDDAILGLAALLGISDLLELANATFANATEEITQQLIIPGEIVDLNTLPEEFNLTFPTNTTAGTVINLIRNGTDLEMTLDNHNDTVSATPTNITWNGNVVYAISAIPLTDAQVEVVGSLINQQQQAGQAGTKPPVGAAAQPAVGAVVQPAPAGGARRLF